LPPGGIVGVIGPNGAGKTTLFRMITGPEKPDAGSIRSARAAHGLCRQSRDSLDGKKDGVGGNLQRPGHHPARQEGSELTRLLRLVQFQRAPTSRRKWARCRAASATACISPRCCARRQPAAARRADQRSHVDTLRALEEALEDFAGCAVIISQRRWFLDRIATHMLAFEGEQSRGMVRGNFQDYEADKMRRLGQDSIIPHRVKYKKFSR